MNCLEAKFREFGFDSVTVNGGDAAQSKQAIAAPAR